MEHRSRAAAGQGSININYIRERPTPNCVSLPGSESAAYLQLLMQADYHKDA